MDTSIYNGKNMLKRHCMKYEFIDPLKNMKFTLISGIEELSIVILGITKLCLLYLFISVYLNILFIQNFMNCDSLI